MPRVISYTPAWLSRPNPGAQIFSSTPSTLSPSHKNGRSPRHLANGGTDEASLPYEGHKKVLARRGTEIFMVADNQIRWSDLSMLQNDWEGKKIRKQRRSKAAEDTVGLQEDAAGEDERAISYRVLKASFSERIRELSVSPNGRYLAITTSHTTHVALIPDAAELGRTDKKSIRITPKMIGPTTHVVSQSPLVSVLWHPFGAYGNCLVTITQDAEVRVWELNFKDTWSFDSPSLSIDLKKLASGVSEKEDFRAYSMNRNRGFSVDRIGMNVAAACFGGTGSSEESPWSAMTLWIVMREGDIYALCPLLPEKWQPSATTLASLSASAMTKQAWMHEDSLQSEQLRQYEDQYRWISDIDGQDPMVVAGKDRFSFKPEIYARPLHPSIPKLQGPFQILDEDEIDLDVSDIHVIAAKIDGEEIMYGEEADSDSGLGMDDEIGLSAAIICLLTRAGRIYLSVDFIGVEGQWLPRSRHQHHPIAEETGELHLTIIEILDSLTPESQPESEWPSFTADESSRYSFFVTHSQGVFFFSLEPWVQILENELQNTTSVGTAFRIDVLANSSGTLRERIIDLRHNQDRYDGEPTAAIVLWDSDLGYFLLTAVNNVPFAALLDKPDSTPADDIDHVTSQDLAQSMDILALRPTRSPYVAPDSLHKKSELPMFLADHAKNWRKRSLNEEIRLSSATLNLMTDAHRVISQETHILGVAAADLFRRCERLQEELRDQISRVKDIVNRVDQAVAEQIVPEGEFDEPRPVVDARLAQVLTRQDELQARFNQLKARFAEGRGQELSDKECDWIADTQRLRKLLIPPDEEEGGTQNGGEHVAEPWERLEEAKRLAKDLIAQAKEASSDGPTDKTNSFTVPPDLRKAKVEEVMGLLDRQSALIDAAQIRLERLSLASVS